MYRAGMPGTTATRDALRCVRCRYALEALPAGGPCPECGLAVAESAHRREVHAIRRLRAVRVGAVVEAVDAAARSGLASVYVEILSKHGHRVPAPIQPEAVTASETEAPDGTA